MIRIKGERYQSENEKEGKKEKKKESIDSHTMYFSSPLIKPETGGLRERHIKVKKEEMRGNEKTGSYPEERVETIQNQLHK